MLQHRAKYFCFAASLLFASVSVFSGALLLSCYTLQAENKEATETHSYRNTLSFSDSLRFFNTPLTKYSEYWHDVHQNTRIADFLKPLASTQYQFQKADTKKTFNIGYVNGIIWLRFHLQYSNHTAVHYTSSDTTALPVLYLDSASPHQIYNEFGESVCR